MIANGKFEKWLSGEDREEALEAVREHRDRNRPEIRPKSILRRPAPEPTAGVASEAAVAPTGGPTAPSGGLSASLASLAPELEEARRHTPPAWRVKARAAAKRFGEEAVLLYYRFYFLTPKGKRRVLAIAAVGVAVAFAILAIAPRRQRAAMPAAEPSHERLTSGPPKKAAPAVEAPKATAKAKAKVKTKAARKRLPAASKRAAHGKSHARKSSKKGRSQRRSR